MRTAEPNGTDKPRVGPKGTGAVHGGEAAKPAQRPTTKM